MALSYEEAVGPLHLQPSAMQYQVNLRRISSAAAVIGLIILGGFTALVSSAIVKPAGVPVHHNSGF
ncbi:MAG: hypothetical protein F6J87_11320 [Spirulina sp. SIO3F2]|nr:hypothetical protein [Spirulina sp. SIO3F2]